MNITEKLLNKILPTKFRTYKNNLSYTIEISLPKCKVECNIHELQIHELTEKKTS